MKTLLVYIAAFLTALTLHAAEPAGQDSTPFAKAESKAELAERQIDIHVKGMVCDFCARGLEKTFGKLKQIDSMKVDLGKSLVSLQLKKDQSLSDNEIAKMIKDNGYELVKIERGKGVQAKSDKASS